MKTTEVRTTIDLPKPIHAKFRKIKKLTGKNGKQMFIEKIQEEYKKLGK